jgi:uncharacterized alkaline shock family protein YloU
MPEPAVRGTLDIRPNAISRIASRAIADIAGTRQLARVDVPTARLTTIELAASIVLPYPEEPLTVAMNRLREHVAQELTRQTGRAVSRIDLRVDRFIVGSDRPARRVP